MTGRILAITGLTLLCLAAVAAMPPMLVQPDPRTGGGGPNARSPVLVVRSGTGAWFLNGRPVSPGGLVSALRGNTAAGPVRFLASGALTMKRVSASLAWLRRHSRQPVMLELASEAS